MAFGTDAATGCQSGAMSNYLTVVASSDMEPALLRWLGPHLAAGEHCTVELPGAAGLRLHHVARQAAGDLVPAAGGGVPGGALFRGYALEPDGGALVFAAEGVRPHLEAARSAGRPGWHAGPLVERAGEEWDGVHLAVSWSAQRLTAHTDFFRTLPMLYTAAAGIVAFSDSWQLLVRLRTALGLPVDVDTATVCAMSVQKAISEHPLSDRTACAQVRLVGVGARLEVPLGAPGVAAGYHVTDPGRPGALIRQRPFPEAFAPPPGSWGEEVRRGALRMAGTMAALAGLPGARLDLAMSGGVDSRSVLAAARCADPGQWATRPSVSNFGPANQRDVDVVEAFTDALGIRLAGPQDAPPVRLAPYASPLAVWMLGSLGLHDRIKVAPGHALPSPRFLFGGFGGETIKGNYGWRPFTAIARQMTRLAPGPGEFIGRQGTAYLRSVGIDPAAPDAGEWHYVGIRNSLHGGRDVLGTLFCGPPLNQRRLIALAHAPAGSPLAIPRTLRPESTDNVPGRTDNAVMAMLCLLDPELALQPFDRPAKDLHPDRLREILCAAGGPVSAAELAPPPVTGRPEDVTHGAAETFLSLARQWGQDAPLDHEGIAPLVHEGARIAREAGFGDWYANQADNASRSLQARDRLSHQSGSYGHLMTFLPLAGAGLDEPVPPYPAVTAADRPQAAGRPAAPAPDSPSAPPPAVDAAACAAEHPGARTAATGTPARLLRRLGAGGGRRLARLWRGRGPRDG